MKLPKALPEFSLTPQVDDTGLSDLWTKSLYDNIVNPITARDFMSRGNNSQEIQSILNSIELFERKNFSRLASAVSEIARKNKEYCNIDYDLLNIADPFNDNYETLVVDGWRRHIFNIIYVVRSDPKHYESWHKEYLRWKICYDIVRSGSDPGDLCSDMDDLGF